MKRTTERLLTFLAFCVAVGAVALLVAGQATLGATLLVAGLALFAIASAPHGVDDGHLR